MVFHPPHGDDCPVCREEARRYLKEHPELLRASVWSLARWIGATLLVIVLIMWASDAAAQVEEPAQSPPAVRGEGHTQTMTTTAYCCAGRGGGYCGLTASGAYVRPGAVAAAWHVPFGSVVHIPGYGIGEVLDRGGAVGPGVLDVWFWDCAQAWQWGRRQVTVTWGWPEEPAEEEIAALEPEAGEVE